MLLKGDNVGDIMLYGRGAGALPTGSAIVSDIIYAAQQTKHKLIGFSEDKFLMMIVLQKIFLANTSLE